MEQRGLFRERSVEISSRLLYHAVECFAYRFHMLLYSAHCMMVLILLQLLMCDIQLFFFMSRDDSSFHIAILAQRLDTVFG